VSPFPIDPARATGPMRLVLSAYPSRDAARRAVRGALTRRLAACASVIPADSEFWWKGRLESAAESLVLFKTVPKRVGHLVRFLQESHPYDVPEVAEVDVPRVNTGYLDYLSHTLDPNAVPPRARRSGARRGRGAPAPGRTRAPRRRPSR
jgi:periplasmic divalent cation tolerance protein